MVSQHGTECSVSKSPEPAEKIEYVYLCKDQTSRTRILLADARSRSKAPFVSMSFAFSDDDFEFGQRQPDIGL